MRQYNVTGMSCAACSARVEKAVGKVPGVTSCSVSLLTNSMGVEGDVPPEQIIAAVEQAGYGASLPAQAGVPARGAAGHEAGKRLLQPGRKGLCTCRRQISTGRIAAFGREERQRQAVEGAEARDRRLTVGPAVVDESKPDRSIAAQRFGDGFGAAPAAEG